MANTLGDRLRNLRTDSKLTQAQLAKLTGLSVSAIKSYENGWREPNSKAMVALERYFNVSGEYLRGETDQRDIMKWDDPEIMATVRESLPAQLGNLNDILKNSPDQEQKLVFDILTELAHVLKLPDAAQRTAAISLLEGVFAASTRFADVCIGAVQDIDLTRMEKAKKTALAQYGAALDAAVFFHPD